MDWITILIELVGVAILVTWIVIPIREFRQILRAVKNKPYAPFAEDIRGGEFPIDPNPPSREERPRT